MKKITSLFLGLAFCLCLIPVSAEKWQYSGSSYQNSLWIDLDSVQPVLSDQEGGIVPNLYKISYRFGKELGKTQTSALLIDLEANKELILLANEKDQKWETNATPFSLIWPIAYLSTHQEEFKSNSPYQLPKKLDKLGKRKASEIPNKKGWQTSYDIKNVGKAALQINSIQFASSEVKKIPTLRFLGEVETDTLHLRLLIEADAAPKPEYRIVQAWTVDKKNWFPLPGDVTASSSLALHKDIAYLAADAYQYAGLNLDKVVANGTFTPGVWEEEAQNYLQKFE